MLPGEQNRKQCPCAGADVASRRCPAGHRGNRSRNRAERGVPPTYSFQRRVNEDVKKCREQHEEPRQKIHRHGQEQHPAKHQSDPKRQRADRLNQSCRQGPVPRSDHFGVKVPFQIIIQHRRAPGSAPHAEQREKQERHRVAACATKKKSQRRRYQDHDENPRLCKLEV